MSIITKIGRMFMKKGWDSEWLKGSELNKLAQGSDLTLPAQNSYLVNRCVNLISQNFPQVPLIIYNVKTGDPISPDSEIYNPFIIPNEYMTYYGFWSRVSMFYTLYGESFIYIERNKFGTKVLSMQVVDPRSMKEVLHEKSNELIGWLFDKKLSLDLKDIIGYFI